MSCLAIETRGAEPAEAVLFENADWTVTSEALEHRRADYAVSLAALDERRPDGLWVWPVHLMEKSWCEPQLFAEAFFAAIALAGFGPDQALAASFRQNGRAVLGLVGGRSARTAGKPRREAVRLGDLVAGLAPAESEPLRRAG